MVRPQQQPSAVPRDNVNDAAPLGASALAPNNEAVYAGLQPLLEVREGVEVEFEEALTVAVADGARGEVAEEALSVVRVLAWEPQELERGPEGSHFVAMLCGFLAPGYSDYSFVL